MTPILVPLAALTLAAPPQWCDAPFGPRMRERMSAPSLTGIPGLLEVPAAVSLPDPGAALAFNSTRTQSVAGQTQQRNAFVSVGFLPRLTLVARGSVMDKETYIGAMRDISVNAHLVVSPERGNWPSIAVGAQDFGGAAPHFEAQYVVASRTLFGRARATLGFGRGSYSLDGVFGGVEVSPCSWITIIGENESRRRNFGVRLAPLGDWGVRTGIEPTFDLIWREGQGRMAGVGLRLQAGPFRDGGEPRRPGSRAAAPARSASGTEALRDALVTHGFENVYVATAGDTLDVAYENRVFNREEWDALGVVMGEVLRASGGASAMRITLLRVGLPVLRVTSSIAAFRGFIDGTITPDAFAEQLGIDHSGAVPSAVSANSSRFRLDLTIRPRIESMLLTEISVAETRISAMPEAAMHLGRGISITGRRAVVLHSSQRFPQEYDEPNADRLLVHFARPGFPLGGSSPGALSQVSIGRFGAREVGAAVQTDVPMGDGTVSIGGMAAAFGEGIDSIRRSVALGTLRLRYAPLGIRTIITAGRFLHGDLGASVEVERRFGLAEVAFYAQGTDIAKVAGLRVSVPLTLARDMRPAAVRIRLPDYYDWRKWTTVAAPTNDIHTDVAIPLETGQDLVTAFRGRDRLNRLWLMSQIGRLRVAAVRWVLSGG